MVYHLDEANTESWANGALWCLCYSCAPGMLQYRMGLAFSLGVSRVRVPGTEVVPIALAEALDGKDTRDYHQRVEPSIRGGRKLAWLILSKLGLVDDGGGDGSREEDAAAADDEALVGPLGDRGGAGDAVASM